MPAGDTVCVNCGTNDTLDEKHGALYRGHPCCVRCWHRLEKLAERNEKILNGRDTDHIVPFEGLTSVSKASNVWGWSKTGNQDNKWLSSWASTATATAGAFGVGFKVAQFLSSKSSSGQGAPVPVTSPDGRPFFLNGVPLTNANLASASYFGNGSMPTNLMTDINENSFGGGSSLPIIPTRPDSETGLFLRSLKAASEWVPTWMGDSIGELIASVWKPTPSLRTW